MAWMMLNQPARYRVDDNVGPTPDTQNARRRVDDDYYRFRS